MGARLNIAVLSILLILFTSSNNARAETLDLVAKFGAKADGKTDISTALLAAWKEACSCTSPTKIFIPKGTYALSKACLEGPCKAPIELQVDGTILAPADASVFKAPDWVTFNRLGQLTLSGCGVFDGQGAKSWGSKCKPGLYCGEYPINLRFNFVNNSLITGVTTKDSKQFQVNVLGCHNITFLNFKISAPAESLNTDGIHIGRSNGVNITNCEIKTGDDCISMGDGSKNVHIQGVTCGPGHGISVGSLGKFQNEEPVEGITIKNCTLDNSDNGVRIKTWPASFDGAACDMHFEDIIMKNVSNPIIIDQQYCPWNKCNLKLPSKIKLSKISFKNIRGTSSTQQAVKLVCSSGIPCEGVELADIDITYNGPEGPATSQCANVKPTLSGKQNPTACSTPVSPPGSVASPAKASTKK